MIGNHTLTITIYDSEGNELDKKTTTLKVSQKSTSPVANKVVLCIGDSLTSGGEWPDELNRRLTKLTNQTSWGATAPTGLGLSNITFIGKKVYLQSGLFKNLVYE